jgi:hypothetical protein
VRHPKPGKPAQANGVRRKFENRPYLRLDSQWRLVTLSSSRNPWLLVRDRVGRVGHLDAPLRDGQAVRPSAVGELGPDLVAARAKRVDAIAPVDPATAVEDAAEVGVDGVVEVHQEVVRPFIVQGRHPPVWVSPHGKVRPAGKEGTAVFEDEASHVVEFDDGEADRRASLGAAKNVHGDLDSAVHAMFPSECAEAGPNDNCLKGLRNRVWRHPSGVSKGPSSGRRLPRHGKRLPFLGWMNRLVFWGR